MRKTINKELLVKEYINKEKSINQLAREIKISHRYIARNLKKNNIPIRSYKQQQQIDYNHKRNKNLNLLHNNIEKNPLFFYILGALRGDGRHNFNRNCIQINVIDKDFLQEIKKVFNELSPQTRVKIRQHTKQKRNSKEQWRISLCCKDFFDRRLYLLRPISMEEKINYLRGLWDAEGSVGLFERQVKRSKIYKGHDKWLTISQKSIINLEEWASYLEDLGIEFNKQYKDDGRSYLRIRKNESIRLFNGIIGFRIRRKQEKLEEVIAYINKWNIVRQNIDKTKIKSIRKIGKRKTYDIETPDYHNFILDNGIISHNSVLAMTVCAYLASKLENLNPDAYNIDNIFFDNAVMVKEAQKRPKYSIIHYDEGREGLAASKAIRVFQQDLMDFFAECGQLNHIFVIVCPDFFELKENMAVARSECLINVYRKEVPIQKDGMPIVRLDRGQFECFNKNKKRLLYDIARTTRKKYYNIVKANFRGSFTNQYTINKEKYLEKKKNSLARFDERHKETKAEIINKKHLKKFVCYYKKIGLSGPEIQKKIEEILEITLSPQRINAIFRESGQYDGEIKQYVKKSEIEPNLGSAYNRILRDDNKNGVD